MRAPYTPATLAEQWQCSERHIRNHINNCKLRAFRLGGYRIGRLNGKFVLVFDGPEGKRRRFRLDAKDASEAYRIAPGIHAELTRPKGTSVAEIWQAYTQ